MNDNPYRLPTTAWPQNYRLEMRPDLEAARFDAEVSILIEVAEPTHDLVLNAMDLDIHRAWLGHPDADLAVTLDADTERVTFSSKQLIEPGPVQLNIVFSGILNDKLMGFYRSTFTVDDPETGEKTEHAIAVTQFESTHARQAFPCFDEPAFKATFDIDLVIDKHLLAVSNGAEIRRTSAGDGLVRVTFAQTMSMSTYLVAFVVGPLEATDVRVVKAPNGDIPLRVIYPPGSAHLCDFALETADAALRFFETYYEIPYPGDKVDLVAVPDFAFGAMENLGCITFREVLLLINPAEATQAETQRVADVINHELAHMWFGDLVTMNWWNGIWLNEAFATFMEVMATDSFKPEWDVWTTFGLARAAAFDTDALSSTRPIEYEVVSPADSEGMFDILTYEKGASVVRMLEQYLGAEAFRRGIVAYLKKHAYGVTETTDLWDALEEESGEPVRRIMDNWIFRGGHPLVHVEATDSGVRLSQERFRFDGDGGGGGGEGAGDAGAGGGQGAPVGGAGSSGGTVESSHEPWPVPMVLSARVGSGDDASMVRRNVLLEDETTVDLGGRPDLVQPNLGGSGFYRSSLAGDLMATLGEDTSGTALERFVLLDDTCAALYADRAEVGDIRRVLTALSGRETDPSVWRRIGGAAREVQRLLGGEQIVDSQAWIVDLAQEPLARFNQEIENRTGAASSTSSNIGSDPEMSRLVDLRAILFSLVGGPGADHDVGQQARALLGQDDVDASLLAASIEVVARSATTDEHREIERRWRSAETPQEELRYLTALVDTDNVDLFDHALELAATEVRTQNAPYLIRRALSHRTLGARGWEFVESRWEALSDRFPSNSLPRMLEGIRSTTDRELAERIDGFLARTEVPSGGLQVVQHVERMWVTIRTAERVRRSPSG